MTYVGVSRAVEDLHLMGSPDKNINADPFGLALGSAGLTPVQMAVAFGTIANKGVYQQPLSFSRIVDSNGNVVVDMHQQQDRHQVFKPATTCEEIFALVPVPLCTASLSISTTRYAVEGLNT